MSVDPAAVALAALFAPAAVLAWAHIYHPGWWR